jgi:hypothetical protein
MAVEAATPKRAAAARQLSPPSIAASLRDRKSIESGLPIHAGLHSPASIVNQIIDRLGIPDLQRTKAALIAQRQ